MRGIIRATIKLLLYLLVFVLLVDPADAIMGLKLPLFALVVCVWLVEKAIFRSVAIRQNTVIFLFAFIIIPVLGLLIALMQGNLDNTEFAVGYLKSISILSLLLVLDDMEIDIFKVLIHTSIILPILTIFVYITFVVDPDYFNQVFFTYFTEETGTASFSLRNYYGFDLAMFFFKSSPLLVFPVGYCAYKMMNSRHWLKYLLLTIIFLFTLFLSGTRANMLAGLLIFLILVFANLVRRKNKAPLFFASAVLLYLAGVFIYNASFADKDISQQIKSEHVTSYIDLFVRSPQYLLWGQGLGSEFYSKGFGFYTPLSELTYVDIIRMFGIPLGGVFIFLTVYPVLFLMNMIRHRRKALYPLVSYGAYLFIAGTNPLLISSTGILAILAIFSVMRRLQEPQYSLAMTKH